MQIALDDSKAYPAAVIEAALGERCVAEICRAAPQSYADHGIVRDRAVINPGALGYWLFVHFGLNIFADAGAAQVSDIDPLAERVVVNGKDYLIPHWCYLAVMPEPGDERPRHWPGIAKAEKRR